MFHQSISVIKFNFVTQLVFKYAIYYAPPNLVLNNNLLQEGEIVKMKMISTLPNYLFFI